jgi:DNA gyrase subunit A
MDTPETPPTTPEPVPAAPLPPIAGESPINITEEMQRSYIDYSMSVIVGRALPDARDGMKPGARRILFSMHLMGLHPGRPYKKCAYIVGDVLGKYHPHGDSAVYETLVRMAQPFALRYPLVDGQGNFGSIDGDNAAAYRYTEARLRMPAEELLADIEKNTVAMVKNYNGELDEPSVLPARLPNLLMNGSTGIAVGMATNIPPHNLGELIDAVIILIDKPNVSVEELARVVKGPDFPTGGTICGVRPIADMYKTGRGQIRVRGKADVEELKAGREAIIITEIPYAVNKANMVAHIAQLVNDKMLDGISDIRDESSSKGGLRVVIELKRGAVAKIVLNNLFKHTQLQTTFGAILLALDHGQPKVMNLKELLQCFISHRFEVVTRRTRFELEKAEARAHILEGLKIAIDHLDEVVRLIRASKNREEAKASLIGRFGFTEIQVNAILDMRLYQLTSLERDKLEEEYLGLIKTISYLRDLLANPRKIYGVIREDLLDLKKIYADGRMTDIVPDEGEVNMEDLIVDRPCVITISHRGYIKRVPVNTYKDQRRGGRGITGVTTREEDFVEHLFVASTHDTLLFFTNQGRVYAERVYGIPDASRQSQGKAIVNMLELREEEAVAAMLRIRAFTDNCNVFFATERGVVKKTALTEFRNIRKGGLIAINLEEGDRLIQVRQTSGKDEIMLSTRSGMAIRFPEGDVRPMGRDTTGVKGISLDEGDAVESMDLVSEDACYLTATKNGYGKRTDFAEYRIQGRGGKGIIGIQTSDRNGPVVASLTAREEDSIVMVTANGMLIRSPVKEVRVIGRNTQGVRLINLEEGDSLVSVTTVEGEDDTKLDQEAAEVTTAPPPEEQPKAEENGGGEGNPPA